MQGYIKEGRVWKPGYTPNLFIARPDLAPPFLMQHYGFWSYKYVEGRMMEERDVESFLNFMKDVWRPTGKQADLASYVDYVWSKSRHIAVYEAILHLLRTPINEVETVHGDCTFENVLVPFQLIDPGLPRGAYCAENDRGKLLQSYMMNWETRGWLHSNVRPLPSWATPTDLAMLITHWARLIPHWPDLDFSWGFNYLLQELRRHVAI